MSNPNTTNTVLSNQTKQEESKRWWTGAAQAAVALGYAVQNPPPPTPQSSTTTLPNPRAQSRRHDSNAKARAKRYQEWTAYGNLEPSGCPPWFL